MGGQAGGCRCRSARTTSCAAPAGPVGRSNGASAAQGARTPSDKGTELVTVLTTMGFKQLEAERAAEELRDRYHCDVVPSPSGVVHHLFWRR